MLLLALLLLLLLLLFIYGSGVAGALSAMPMPTGKENPFSFIFAIFVGFTLICGAILAVDWLTERIVRHMKEGRDTDGLIRALKSGWLARKAACALGDLKDTKAVGPLIDALEDTNDEVRQVAAKALGDIGDDRAAGPLRLALADRYWGVRDCASYALGKLQKQDNVLNP